MWQLICGIMSVTNQVAEKETSLSDDECVMMDFHLAISMTFCERIDYELHNSFEQK